MPPVSADVLGLQEACVVALFAEVAHTEFYNTLEPSGLPRPSTEQTLREKNRSSKKLREIMKKTVKGLRLNGMATPPGVKVKDYDFHKYERLLARWEVVEFRNASRMFDDLSGGIHEGIQSDNGVFLSSIGLTPTRGNPDELVYGTALVRAFSKPQDQQRLYVAFSREGVTRFPRDNGVLAWRLGLPPDCSPEEESSSSLIFSTLQPIADRLIRKATDRRLDVSTDGILYIDTFASAVPSR